jgi:hypothetical protein
MVEDLGLSIPIITIAWLSPRETVKSQYTTPEERCAEADLRWGPYYGTPGMLYRFGEICKAWDVDGFVMGVPYTCRPSFANPIYKRALEQDFDIPILALEWDVYDSRDYSAQALRTRMETFAETLRARKAY